MQARLRFLLLLPAVALVACGGNSTPVTGTSYTPASGDYVITAGVGTASAANLSGDLIVNQPNLCNDATVCGAFIYANSCAASSQPIPFTGSYQGNVLTLTSASFSGSVATLTIKLPFANNNLQQQIATGTSVIAGGPCALASSPLQAELIPSFSGTWNVTVGTAPSTTTASLVVTQSTAANGDGSFSATATIACSNASGPPVLLSGSALGTSLQLWLPTQPPPTGSPVFTANYSVVPPAVSACGGTGTMTLQ